MKAALPTTRCEIPPGRSAENEPAPPLVTVLCGGLGGARLALMLQAAGLESRSCFVTNVGDDCEAGGLPVCPDTDAVLYALGGIFDEARGWGVRGDVFPAAAQGGADDWFCIGERDRTQHRARRALLESGLSLSAVTARLAQRLGVTARVLPATDDRLRTHVHTTNGVLAWQEWWVRERARPAVATVEYRGVDRARAPATVLAAIRDAALLVIAASSPVASVGPILALPGIADAIRARRGPRVALSPIVRRRPPQTARDAHRAAARAALLAAAGIEHDPVAVARRYVGLVDTYILDDADADDAAAVAALGIEPRLSPTLDRAAGPRLVRTLLDLLSG